MTLTPSKPYSQGPTAQPSSLKLTEDGKIQAFEEERRRKNLVSWVKTNYEAAKRDRQRFERQWALNMAFYRGRQYLQYFPANNGHPLSGKLFQPPGPSWAARTVTNRIRPIIRTEMARLTSNKPNASVVPASSEDQDLFAAQAGEQVWESFYNGKQLMKPFKNSMFWLCICGTSFMKVWWDPSGYDCVSKEQGTIQYAPVTPYHIFIPDLYETDLENQPWVINAYTKPAYWVKNTYGLEVNPTVVEAKSPFDEAMLETAMGINEAKPDSVMVYECWFKPGCYEPYPQGGMVTVVGDQLVAEPTEGWPYSHNEYPFIKFDHIDTGMFYAESVITDLIPLQREFNRTKNQINESKNRMSKPQLIAPKGSVEAKKITSEPGLLIEYKPGLSAPTPLPLQSVPNYVMNMLQQEIVDMEDISSQHQVSRGQAPPGVTAATAISFMQERDDSLMTSVYQSVEHGWEKIAKHTLSHIVQFWETGRIVSVTGVDGSFDSIALKGTELASGTDIRMEAGSALPVSKAAKQAFLLDLMKMGMIDPQEGLKLMDMGGIDKLYDELKIDERQAQRENLKMANLAIEQIQQHEQQAAQQKEQMQQMMQMQAQQQMQQAEEQGSFEGMEDQPLGMPPTQPGQQGPVDLATGAPLEMPMNIVPVNTWDNHQLHIEVHNRYRKSQAFELLTEPVKQQFELHVQMHANALNVAAANAMMMPPLPGEADNGAGAPVGSNQFGPPGTEEGAPPPEMMGM